LRIHHSGETRPSYNAPFYQCKSELIRGWQRVLQLDWASPFSIGKSSQLNFHLTSGYGDNLIDYNHWRSMIGIGVVFKGW
jgi:outer membrane phospholipase A